MIHFLDHIGKDFGRERQIQAANAVLAHSEYYASLGYDKQVGNAELARTYL